MRLSINILSCFLLLAATYTQARASTNGVIDAAEVPTLEPGVLPGLLGQAYIVPVDTTKIPDFSLMTPFQTFVLANVAVPAQSSSSGFPNVANVSEWYGIRLDGRLFVPENGFFEFLLTADDGAILYIDGAKVIDHDGIHPPTTKVSPFLYLSRGYHTIRIDYFQGPHDQMALQLYWRNLLSGGELKIIDPAFFSMTP